MHLWITIIFGISFTVIGCLFLHYLISELFWLLVCILTGLCWFNLVLLVLTIGCAVCVLYENPLNYISEAEYICYCQIAISLLHVAIFYSVTVNLWVTFTIHAMWWWFKYFGNYDTLGINWLVLCFTLLAGYFSNLRVLYIYYIGLTARS